MRKFLSTTVSTLKRMLKTMFEKKRKQIKHFFSFKKRLTGVNVWNESGKQLDTPGTGSIGGDKVSDCQLSYLINAPVIFASFSYRVTENLNSVVKSPIKLNGNPTGWKRNVSPQSC